VTRSAAGARRLLPRTLRSRLTAGLVLLLATACLAVGVATVLALQTFLVGRLDQQLTAEGGRLSASLEDRYEEDAEREEHEPDIRGQAPGTLGVRLKHGKVGEAVVVHAGSVSAAPLDAGDRATLTALTADGTGRSVELGSLDDYRVMAVPGRDEDVLVTGLPLHGVEETVHRLELVEGVVFGGALLATGVAGALWVRVSLRPLRRVTSTASRVAELPLANGTVAVPDRVPDTDPRTEVGQVGAALNRMLGHVEDALAKRQASEARLRRFAADASHELRTPVASIRGHAELALRHPAPVPGDIRHALGRIQAESVRMGGLVDDLLLLARLDAGRPLAHETVDLTRLVLDSTSDARAAGPNHRWMLELPEEPVTVTGDGHRLHQVVTNLLANARTHTPAGTTVTVRLRPAAPGEARDAGAGSAPAGGPDAAADRVELTVADNGPGMPDEIAGEIFERFVRAGQGRSRKDGTTGLGLAIVRAVIIAHGGSVELVRRPGMTVFRVLLPRG
jgi:two-component system OmpR family sensor kinase